MLLAAEPYLFVIDIITLPEPKVLVVMSSAKTNITAKISNDVKINTDAKIGTNAKINIDEKINTNAKNRY